ncbi:MAG: D-alanine--D-alanine ligase [Desulfobacterales bacterium]
MESKSTRRLRLALIAGGVSAEREVSLNSGRQVLAALDPSRYEVTWYDPRTDLPRLVQDAPKIDAALILLHGPFGEDGTIQGMLDLLGVPYQGSGVLGSAVAMNKIAAKRLYREAGIPVPDDIVLKRSDPLDAGAVIARLGMPLVVKPVTGGSSVGVSVVRRREDLSRALSAAFAHDREVMLECFIEGLEITGAVIGNDELEALPLIEIVPGGGYEFFDYEAKYTAGATEEICPARIDPELASEGMRLAVAAHRALFCRGYSRTDMILRGREIFVLETNTIPGMTATSLLPRAAAAAGIDFGRLLDRLIELSLEGRAPRGEAP